MPLKHAAKAVDLTLIFPSYFTQNRSDGLDFWIVVFMIMYDTQIRSQSAIVVDVS